SARWAGTTAQPREGELEAAWVLGLWVNAGVGLGALRAVFGAAPDGADGGAIAELTSEGLVTREGERVALTMQGRLLSNDVFGRLLSASQKGSGSASKRG